MRLKQARFEILTGHLAAARRTLNGLRRPAELVGAAAFERGCLSLKERRWAEAARHFRIAGRRGGPEGLELKAGFYACAALSLAQSEMPLPPTPPRRARLLICGLGIAPPYTASLSALRVIAASDFVFNNLSEPEVGTLVWLLSRDGEPTMFDVRGADARWTRTIFRRVRPGRTTAFVTRGHPQVCGGLAASLMAECRRTGVEFSIYPAVSSMDTLPLRQRPGGAASWGAQVLDWSTLFNRGSRPDRRLPAVLYFNASVRAVPPGAYASFCARLEEVYGPGHRAWFYGRTFHAAPELVPLKTLRAWQSRLDPSYTLLIPPSGLEGRSGY